MKFLRYLVLLILTILVAGAVYFGAQDGSFDLTVNKELHVPQAMAFQTVNNYQTWSQWAPWMSTDPNIQIIYGDPLQGVGAGCAWIGEDPQMGRGSTKTLRIVENESIDQYITHNTPFGKSVSHLYWSFQPESDQSTRINCRIKGELSLLEKVFVSFQAGSFEETTKTIYNLGLENIERHLTEQIDKYAVNLEGIVPYQGGYYMYVSGSSTTTGRIAKLQPMLDEIKSYMQEHSVAQNGAPFTLFHEIDKGAGTVLFSAAIPVQTEVNTGLDNHVLCGYIQPLTAVKSTLQGNYSHLDSAAQAAHTYIEEKALTLDPEHAQFEVYTTDPRLEPNPANWTTEVYVPIVSLSKSIQK